MVQIDYRLKQQQQRCFPFFFLVARSIGGSFPAVYLFNFFCPSSDKTVQPFALSIDSQPNRNGWLTCTALIIIFQSRFNGHQRRAGENAPPLRRVVHVRGGPASATHNISRLLMISLSGPKGDSLRDKTREFSIFFGGTGPVLVQLRCSSRYFCVWYSPNVGLSLASRTLQINVRFRRLCVLGSNKRLARLPELFFNELVV